MDMKDNLLGMDTAILGDVPASSVPSTATHPNQNLTTPAGGWFWACWLSRLVHGVVRWAQHKEGWDVTAEILVG